MTTPDAARWAPIKALFDECADLPPGQRAALIAAANLDAEALAELQSLLDHHDEATRGRSFLAENAFQHLIEGTTRVGQVLGAWEIVRPVGVGGMGEVFEARRADGSYQGRSAVKLLKRGMDSAAVLQRFAQERQALARLGHPNIARLLDAGTSADGLPYFVLEYVDGKPIDEAVRGKPIEARLQLFLQLADAVSYAHRNLLVHRDLKPGNVLVDDEGQVKLLDFGIAKALDPTQDNDGHATVAGQRPFTPHYASPEQVRGEPVSTATDIYSLGVLLYRILTGSRPTGRHATTPAEAARSVLDETPTRPSRLPESETEEPDWPASRKRLAGDLDNILMKALEKEPERRYASVEALRADVQAHLDGYPVSARAATRGYLLRKFVARNRSIVGVATLGVLALVVGLAATAWQAHRAELARAAADARLAQTRSIARDLVMRYADTIMYLPGGMTMQVDLLKDTVAHLDNLAVDATADPGFAGELATAYARLASLEIDNFAASVDQSAAGARHLARALELFPIGESSHRGDVRYSVWWARALQAQFNQRRGAGDIPGALESCQTRKDLMDATLVRFPSDRDARNELGSAWFCIGQLNFSTGIANMQRADVALNAFEKAEALYLGLTQDGPKEYGTFAQLGTIAGARLLALQSQDRVVEAIAQGQRAVAFKETARQLAPDNVSVRNGLGVEANNFGNLLLEAGRAQEALEMTTLGQNTLRALAIDDPKVARWGATRRLNALHHGRALFAAGQPAEAIAPLRESIVEMSAATAGPMVRRRGWGELALAESLQANHQNAAAKAEVARALVDLDLFISKAPRDTDALVLRGRALHLRALLANRNEERLADLEAARASFELAGETRPLRAHQERDRKKVLAAIASASARQ